MLNQMSSAVYYAGTFDLSGDTPLFTPAFEYQETTMQVPFGVHSILSELFAGRMKPIEAIVFLQMNHHSTWANGKTYWISGRGLAKAIGVSHRYIRKALESFGKLAEGLENRDARHYLPDEASQLRRGRCATRRIR